MIKLNRIFSKLVNEQILTRDKDQMFLKTTATKPIADAVVNRKKIDFFYNGPKNQVKAGNRFKVEPFAIGITKKGNLALRAWVDSGSGSTSKKGFNLTNWRTFILSRMRNIKITDETFTIRPGYKHGEEGNEGPIQKILVSTDFTQKPKVKKVTPKVTTKKVEPEKVQLVKKEHSKFDIWFFLDASLIVKLGGLKYLPKFKEKWEFSDWDTAWSKFQEDRTKKNKGIEEENPKYIRGTVKSFKRFMRDEYGLNMDSNIKLAEKVAKTMLKNGEVPQELEEIIHSIISPHASTGLYNAS